MTIKKLTALPTAGKFDEINFDIRGPWREDRWNYALFTTSDFQEWVGAFRVKENSNFLSAELGNGLACIVSGGHGYIIDIDNRRRVKDLETDMIIDLVADKQASSFVISRWWDIKIIDSGLNEIDVDVPPHADGIYFKDFRGRTINLEIEEVGSDTRTTDYFLNLDTRTVEKHAP